MSKYDIIEKPVDISKLKSFDNLKEIVKYTDKNCQNMVEMVEIIVGDTILMDIDEIKSIMQDGDELVSLISQEWTWDCLAGRSWYAIKRRGKIIHEKFCMLS